MMFRDFRLNPALDVYALAAEFNATGRVSIDTFLELECAEALARHLEDRDDWLQIMNAGNQVFELPERRWSELDEPTRDRLDTLVHESARSGFQYRYDAIRVPDDADARETRGTLLDQFAAFLSSDSVVEVFRAITGADDLAFADAQATRYRPGHFLTAHDDEVEGKYRRAAYVLSLTEVWRIEWGGLLLFHHFDEREVQGFAPAFNSLRLFSVPVRHSVSHVPPYADASRVSITGWLRARDDDARRRA
jgi:Rps23 Pro-64 3,4-dihydroxylase Tpa1-like proline 4-hydroxylase